MKFILSQYLRTLKERDEFDKLLTDLLFQMGYVAVSKPQTGNRQLGVDLAVVGKCPDDGVEELLLFVIKQGDVDRNTWDAGAQSVRASLNEVFDTYLRSHIESAHENLRKKIVLATTGDLKQNVQINWDGYTHANASQAEFQFWGGDKTATLIEKHMLDENIFNAEDRTHLRRALALACTIDYDQRDLHRLFLSQLGLNEEGSLKTANTKPRDLVRALRIVNLATQIFSKWSEDEGNLKQSLIATERAILWSWHRIQFESIKNRKKYYPEITESWRVYNLLAKQYFDKLQDHIHLQDGLAGYSRESADFSLVVFEQIGIFATIGLAQILVNSSNDPSQQEYNLQNATVVADALVKLLKNNPVSGSPTFDGNVIEIVLGLILLVLTGHVEQAKEWLSELVKRADYTFKCKRNFPICTDSLDDLVEFIVFDDEELTNRLMRTSWILPTLAAWAVILERDDLYNFLVKTTKEDYPEICMQFWHPTQDLFNYLYFKQAQYDCGETEAPIHLPEGTTKFIERMNEILASTRHNVIDSSPAGLAGITAIDLVASRHFKTPIAPYFWFKLFDVTKTTPVDSLEQVID